MGGRICGVRKAKLRTKRVKKNNRGMRLFIAAFGVLFILFALFLAISDAKSFRAETYRLPPGVTVAGIPVGNMDETAAIERLQAVFDLPVELRYNGARMQFSPSELGFQVDYSRILTQIRSAAKGSSWWDHLWGAEIAALEQDFELLAECQTGAMQAFLESIIPMRYDQHAQAPLPYLQNTNFTPGTAGSKADLTGSLAAIEAALRSPSQRSVDLEIVQTPIPPLEPEMLSLALEANIRAEGFDGLVEVYTQRLSDGLSTHLAVQNYEHVPPDVAYSGASTIKIPIMVSAYRRLDEPIGNLALGWLQAMMYRSSNDASDALMRYLMDETHGPLVVTRDMRELGYQNTFMAGYFLPGSVLLERIETPANSRRDIYLDPDFFNQTVPSEMGDLLARIYRCSSGTELLFEGSVSEAECKSMLELMSKNQIGVLIEAGLPPEARAAHKHGWVVDTDGLLRTMSDSGVIFTPGGDYVAVFFIHTPQQLLFERGNRIIARLSQTLYNAYNLNAQTAWLYE